jgi:hypothetical protein
MGFHSLEGLKVKVTSGPVQYCTVCTCSAQPGSTRT